MVCETVKLPGGQTAIVCSRTRRRPKCRCGMPATLECDWKVESRSSGTCDKPICRTCSTKPAPGKDLCPDHAIDYKRWREAKRK